jgi:hypothetical protein
MTAPRPVPDSLTPEQRFDADVLRALAIRKRSLADAASLGAATRSALETADARFLRAVKAAARGWGDERVAAEAEAIAHPPYPLPRRQNGAAS